ncbi:MAG: two-component system, chemotaxis family, CheB/CheR fusion protein, partial [Myxococcales bacterium]|nr:two-component system, chemotaxis family, CheB/CheR fusion protein [Myxococcales bacterium]
MAFVVIQHLSPDFKSLMDELLARHTDLPIHLVDDGMQVEADNIYLMPSKKEMIISDGRLLLSERGQKQELTLPIDVFFRSLAHDCGSRAVAIVLSGGGSDGSRGIRDVQEAGGLVIVQDTHTAQFDGMPKTARDAGVADWVLAPEDMPHVLSEHGASYASRPATTAGTGMASPRGIEAVYQMLQDEYGIDFTHYKPSTVTRRIERRLALAHSANIDEYVRRLREDRDELDILYRDLLIGVTKFFRDTEAFAVLEQRVLPELLQNAPKDAPLRIWAAGCATGEEAYSMAIALHDLMQKLGERPVKIFATDVHRGSLETAARAVYDAQALANVSEERLGRYFLRIGDAFQVVPDIRQMVVFAHHNVIKDAPFTRVDLVTCRNLLIYLQPAAQQKVLSLFHFALKRGGVLFLGHSESNGPIARDFDIIDKQWRIYRKHTDAKMMVDSRLQPLLQPQTRATLSQLAPPTARQSLTQLMGTYDALLEDVMPPSLLVSERGELVHAFGGASRFLRLRDGRQDLNVLDVVDQELKLVLVGGLKRALSESATVAFKGVAIAAGEEARPYKVSIRKVRGRNGGPPHLLISFEPMEGAAPAPRPAELEIDLDQISREQLRGLEAELSHTKENLQSAIEELETSNEELQASNEELQASNEELQSTNEELQSVNEELYTVNAEYQRKISELTELANDMDNLLSSTQVGTVFLDQDLKIRKFTPQIAETFSLVPHDLGRSIETFAHKIDHPELVEELRSVLVSGEPVERELRDVHGKAVFLRIFPYRAKATVAGVVLTLIDVTALKAAEDALFHERYLLNSLLATVPDAIYFRDERGSFIRTNHAMARRLGLREPAQAEGKTAFQLLDHAAALALHSQDEAVLRTGEPQLYSLEKRVGRDGNEEWDVATRLPLRDRANQTVGIIGIFRDVSDQKRAELKIRDAVKRRDEFLAMLSHELRNPLGAMVTATAMLKKVDSGTSSRTEKSDTIQELQTKQMSHLMDDLLEASRDTHHKIHLKKAA